MTAGLRRGVAALTAVALIGACGVTVQSEPERIPREQVPGTSPGGTDRSAPERDRVWGAREGQMVPVFVDLPGQGLHERMQAVLSLPTLVDESTTAIPERVGLLRLVRQQDLVIVDLTPDFTSTRPGDVPVAVAQLVLTLTEVPDLRRVQLRAGGRVVPLVLGDGRRIARPLTRQDVAAFAAGGQADEGTSHRLSAGSPSMPASPRVRSR